MDNVKNDFYYVKTILKSLGHRMGILGYSIAE